MPKVNLVDAVSAGALLLAMLQGVIRGLAKELGRLITVAASLAAALLFYRPASLFLQTHFRLPPPKADAVAFAMILTGVMLAVFVGRMLMRKVVTVNLDIKGNKPGGLLAGFLSAAGVVFAVCFAVNLWPAEKLHRRFFDGSLVGCALAKIMPETRGSAAHDSSDGAEHLDQEDILDEPPPPAHHTRHR